MGFTVEGFVPKPGDGAGLMVNAVSPGYFEVMGIPLVAGRGFTDRDDASIALAKGWPYTRAVVNETFVKRYFKGANPIGKHIGIGEDPGVAMPAEDRGARQGHELPVRARGEASAGLLPLSSGEVRRRDLGVRPDGRRSIAHRSADRREVAALDWQLAIYGVATMDERIPAVGLERAIDCHAVRGVEHDGHTALGDWP